VAFLGSRRAAIAGIAVSVACVALLLGRVDLARSWETLTRLDGRLLALPLAAFFLSIALRAQRWRMIFPRPARPPFSAALSALGISNAANFLLPGRAGDLARCALVGRGPSLDDGSRALATVGVEKVLDGLALVAMVGIAALTVGPPRWVFHLVGAGAVLFGGLLLFLFVLRARGPRVVPAVRRAVERLRMPALAARLEAPLVSFADGLGAIGSAGAMLRLFLVTGAIWVVEAGLVGGLALAFGSPISLRSAAVVSAVLGLGLMVPAAPGGLGTYELAGVAAFQLVGIPPSSGLAVTVVIHAWVFLTNTAFGLALLAARGLRLTGLD
jgi:uncharacterized protein (TIRG00374 family)